MEIFVICAAAFGLISFFATIALVLRNALFYFGVLFFGTNAIFVAFKGGSSAN